MIHPTPLVVERLLSSPGESVRSHDDKMAVMVQRFDACDPHPAFVAATVHVHDADAKARACEVSEDRFSLSIGCASLFVNGAQAIDIVGAILQELPADVVEAFARELCERLDGLDAMAAHDAALLDNIDGRRS